MALTKQIVGGAAVALARRGTVAAIVSGLIAAAPVSAAAYQTITQAFSLTIPPLAVPEETVIEGALTTFPKFNPLDGTLDDVSVMVSGSIRAVSFAESQSVSWPLGVSIGDGNVFYVDSDRSLQISGTTQPLSLSWQTDRSNDFEGSGDGEIVLGILVAQPILVESEGPLTGSLTYTYTPGVSPRSPPIPESSTWAMIVLGFGGLGCIGYRQTRRAKPQTA